MRRILALLLGTVVLSGCASMMGDAQQRVEVQTPGANDAVCILDNGETKYRVWSPGTVMMSKRPADLVVTCLADGNRKKTMTIDLGHRSVTLANAFNGFIPGMYVDYTTGAMFEYPNIITVDFTDMPATAMPLPYYHKHLEENPDLFGMEEFRAGRAALLRDRYKTEFELKKREFPGSGANFSEFTSVTEGDQTTEGEGSESSATTSSIDSGPPTDLISDLTRQMNPQVFGPSSSDSDGFAGGTADIEGSGSEPISLTPPEE